MAAAGAAAILLAGCSNPVGGTGVGVQRLEAGQAMGDLRTIDACETFDMSVLEEHGKPREIGQRAFDSCRIAVTIGKKNVTVTIGEFAHAEDVVVEQELDTLPEGGRLVRTEPRREGPCTAHVIFADDVTVESTAQPPSDGDVSAEQACEIADAAARGYYDRVRSDEVAHWEPASNSLTKVSPCGLLADADVADALGVDNLPTRTRPGDHGCAWEKGIDTPPLAWLDFEVNANETSATSKERIADRDSLVGSVALSESIAACFVFTEQLRYANGTRGEVERAALRVWLWTEDEVEAKRS